MDAEQVDQIRALHADGVGCNEIARRLGISQSTVSEHCARLGLTFDRSQTEAATAALVADARARRARLQLGLLEDAERLRGQLFAPGVISAFGGRDNVYREHPVEQPPIREQRDLMLAVNTAISASLRLAEHDADAGADDAKSMLGALAKGLQAAYDAIPGEDGADAGDAPPAD